jgi:hypothetical protein
MACITHCRNCGDIDQRHSARLLDPDIPDGAIQSLEADLGSLLLAHHASCRWVVPIDRGLHDLPYPALKREYEIAGSRA